MSNARTISARFPATTRKLVREVISAGLVVLAISPMLSKVLALSPQSAEVQPVFESRLAVENLEIKEFMERVARTHVVSIQPDFRFRAFPALNTSPVPPPIPVLLQAEVVPKAIESRIRKAHSVALVALPTA